MNPARMWLSVYDQLPEALQQWVCQRGDFRIRFDHTESEWVAEFASYDGTQSEGLSIDRNGQVALLSAWAITVSLRGA
jgi:hypothetical protein